MAEKPDETTINSSESNLNRHTDKSPWLPLSDEKHMRGKLKDRRKLVQSAIDSCSPTEEQKVQKASDLPVYIMNVYTAKEENNPNTRMTVQVNI